MIDDLLRPHRLAAAQLLAVGAVLGGSVLTPPTRGAMLLVPLRPIAASAVVDTALDHGARIGMAGPLPGSFVVRGERARLFRPMLAHGILAIAAPTLWCGR